MRLSVSVTDALGRPLPARGLDTWLVAAVPRRAAGAVTIALVSDAALRRLNRTFRGIDRATDVLSFEEERPQASGPRPQGKASRKTPQFSGLRPRGRGRPLGPGARSPGPFLGDIAIAMGVARRQARQHGHSLQTELRVLALHGVLHLLGYDHEADRGRMERVEERLRRQAGLRSGLIARGPAGVRR